MKEKLVSLNLIIMPGDTAFYYLHKEGSLQGVVFTDMDDFTFSGNADFLKKIITGISETEGV